MSFRDELQPASFRGVPFGVLTGESRFGRRQAVHEYPFRDTPWIEDLGRATRKISFTAFLITDSIVYGGGDVIAQREALIAACETEGSGTLIHPTLGRLTVSVPEDGLVVVERWDEGRYFEVGFSFIETGERVFPAATTDTTSASQASADDADQAASDDYAAVATPALTQGSAIIDQGVSTVSAWVSQVAYYAQDATGLFTMIASLPGNYGRYFPGGTVGYAGRLVVPGMPTTVAGLIQAGSAARAAVTQAGVALVAAATAANPATIATAAQALAAALLGATVDPAVAVRLLAALVPFYPANATTTSVVGLAMASMQAATGTLARRCALGALVRASALYQPPSRDAAAALRDTIGELLDTEILTAGDGSDDASYSALRAMRVAMVTDLNSRGAALPPMKVFDFPSNLPALALSQRMYQTASRSDELILEANPPHPAFMPVSFAALAS